MALAQLTSPKFPLPGRGLSRLLLGRFGVWCTNHLENQSQVRNADTAPMKAPSRFSTSLQQLPSGLQSLTSQEWAFIWGCPLPLLILKLRFCNIPKDSFLWTLRSVWGQR